MNWKSISPVAALVLIWGCGGGGGGSSSPDSGTEITSGMFTTRAAGPSNVLTSGGTGMVIGGLFGTTFSVVRLNQAPMSNVLEGDPYQNMQITGSNNGTVRYYDVRLGRIIEPDLPAAVFGNEVGTVVSPLGNRILYSPYDSVSGNFQIFTANLDGSSRTRLTSAAWADLPQYSPDGSVIIFRRGGQIWRMSTTGSGQTQLTNEASNNCGRARFSADGSLIYYIAGSSIKTMSPTGANVQNYYNSGFSFIYDFDFTPNGTIYGVGDSSGNSRYFIRYPNGGSIQDNLAIPSFSIDIAPDGRRAVLTGISDSRIVDGTSNTIAIGEAGTPLPGMRYAHWTPWITGRTMVGGSSGIYGSSVAGFAYSVVGDRLASFMTASSPTPASVTFTGMPPSGTSQTNLIVTVNAPAGLSSLQYQNGYWGWKQTPVNSNLGANGAMVVYDNDGGEIAYVVPYTAASPSGVPTPRGAGAEKTFNGKFLGIIDAKGKNLAPGGASTVTIDSSTGELKGWK